MFHTSRKSIPHENIILFQVANTTSKQNLIFKSYIHEKWKWLIFGLFSLFVFNYVSVFTCQAKLKDNVTLQLNLGWEDIHIIYLCYYICIYIIYWYFSLLNNMSWYSKVIKPAVGKAWRNHHQNTEQEL